MKKLISQSWAACFCFYFLGALNPTFAQDATLDKPKAIVTEKTLINDLEVKSELDQQRKQRFEMFEKMLTKVRLVGHFTVDGKPMKDLHEETYEIFSAKKVPEGDTWLITARIKYGKNDVTVPMPINVLWADNTPVMTLDKITIPGLGTFSARVVFHEQKYAGTWVHDEVGGHLFGRIEKM